MVTVTITCTVCGMFDKKIEIDTNEHGFFVLPEAHCPHCCAVLEQTMHSKSMKEI
ncbi:hypothetical protein LCGC14_2095360 [marine sediment metagenome]|uniref:Uncharacterized protein n=1 Tax=marine sediment metagenome TaxID=412755 RepID=A0A0F9GPP5_9ZZZZ